MAQIERFLKGLNRRAPASDAAIRACEEKLGVKLPDDYVQLLKASNGCEGTVAGRDFVWLWKVEELPLQNKNYTRLQENPDILGFGLDGELAFAFDMRSPAWPVIEFPFIGRDWEDVTPTGSSFGGFLERLCEFGRGIGDTTILLEIVRTLPLHDPIFSIYAAEPCTPESRASLWQDEERGSSQPMKEEGLSFFRTTGIAQEFFAKARDDDLPSLREKCESLIRYARSGPSGHGTNR